MEQVLDTKATTSIRVDADLYQQVKIRAVHEGRQIKELTESLLKAWVATRDFEIVIHPVTSPQ